MAPTGLGLVRKASDLDHASGVAGGADAAALAGEGHEALGGAVVAPDPGEAMGQDAAAKIGTEVLLDPVRHPLATWVGLGDPGQEGLEVVLDDWVEGRGRGPAAAVDGGEAGGRGGMRVPPSPWPAARTDPALPGLRVKLRLTDWHRSVLDPRTDLGYSVLCTRIA
jgi:hypothetical protein